MNLLSGVGLFFIAIIIVVCFYARLLKSSFSEGRVPLSFRQALWLAITDLLYWFKIAVPPKSGVNGSTSMAALNRKAVMQRPNKKPSDLKSENTMK